MREPEGIDRRHGRTQACGCESEGRFGLLCDSMRDPFARLALDGHIIECNDLCCRLLGYSAHELSELDYADLTPARWHGVDDAVLREQILPRGYSEAYEKEYRRKDGTLVPVELRTVLERDAAGHPSALWAIVRDLSARNRPREALRDSQARYGALAENLPAFLMRFDRDLRVVPLNPQTEGIAGICAGAFQGSTIRDLGMPGDLCDSWESAVRRVLDSERPESLTFDFPAPDGPRTYLLQLVPECDPNGTGVRHVLGVSTDITEHKRVEAQLRASQARMAWVLDRSGVGTWFNSLPLGRLDWDEQTRRLFFLPADAEPTVDLFWSRLHPDDREPTRRAVEAAIRERSLYAIDHRAVHPDTGEVRWIRSIGQATYAPDGTPTRFDGINFDVTDRRLPQQALEAANARLRSIMQAAGVAIFVADDPQCRRVTGNELAHALLGVPDDGNLSATPGDDRAAPPFRVFVGGREASGDELPMQQAVREGRPMLDVELTLEDAAGRLTHLLGNAVPMIDRDGTVTGAVSAFIDITERTRAEEALRESEARFRQLADAMPQLVWIADPRGRVRYYNRRFTDFGGIRPEPDGSWTWQPVLHPDDVQPTVRAWTTAVATGAPYQCEHRVRLADGSWRWHLSRGVSVRDGAGRVVKWFGTATDIHDLKQAQGALQEADRRKDEFLAILAHELRNPLAPIRTGLEVLELGRVDPATASRVVATMKRQVDHLVRLVDDLLEVSRLGRGKIALQRQWVDLADAVRQAIDTVAPSITSRGQKLEVTVGSEPLLMEADPVRLVQILANLLANAARYTRSGGGIRLSARRVGAEAVVSVSDGGDGIPAEMLPRVFDLFAQGERPKGEVQGGLGIGLFLVRSLVELHGGRVEARSDGPGRGSEFVVSLPLTAGITPAPVPTQRLGSAAWAARRVLVVDDNRDAADSLGLLLRSLGADIRVVYDGPAALAAVAERPPAVVLLDLGMPGMDGFEVARRLRADDANREIVLIALTGWGQDDDRRRSAEAGCDRHLVKPPDLRALEAAFLALAPSKPAGPCGGRTESTLGSVPSPAGG